MKHLAIMTVGLFLLQSTQSLALTKSSTTNQKQYSDQDNILRIDADGVGGLLGIISQTFLSLSSLDSSTKHAHIAMIEQAETDALNYTVTQKTTDSFLNAKVTVELLSGQLLTDSQAAIAIVELNQKLRQ
jgi:hypothetical protein